MKKSFKFLAILLALITSASGLSPIGAVNPSMKQNLSKESEKNCQNESASNSGESEEEGDESYDENSSEEEGNESYDENSSESEEENTEMPRKRARKDKAEVLERTATEEQEQEQAEEPVEEQVEEYAEEQAEEPAEEREQIAQGLREREVIAHMVEDMTERTRRTNLLAFSDFHNQAACREHQLSIMARCLIPRSYCVLNFNVMNLHFISEEIKRTYSQNMITHLSDTRECLNSIRENFGGDSIDCKTPSQLSALAVCLRLIFLQQIDNVRTLTPDYLMYLLSISKFTGDPDIPELNTDTPPEEFNVDLVSIRYMNDELTISCYYQGRKVYESMLGCTC